MLIYFIHGVATKDTSYAKDLIKLINEKCKYQNQELPHCYPGFWGDILKGTDKLWRDIDQELHNQKQQDSQFDPEQALRYQNFRKEYFSYFIGDTFSYLSSETGIKIRKKLANQLRDFVNDHPTEKELHIVAHSLGTVILWDVLFGDRFPPSDPVHTIRSLIGKKYGKISLSGVTTMGSPIPFLNLTLGIDEKQIQYFLEEYQGQSLIWDNIINSCDIISYPIKPIFNSVQNLSKIIVTDHYIESKTNWLDSVALTELASLVFTSVNAHQIYWKSEKVSNIINQKSKLTQVAINKLKQIKGMKEDLLKIAPIGRKVMFSADFIDFSGKISWVTDNFGAHHIYVFDNKLNFLYAGFVNVFHAKNFEKEIGPILNKLCGVLSQEDYFQQSVQATA
ncbi:MAG: hypothetical protein WBM62_07685 [Crocosphaera sp.]